MASRQLLLLTKKPRRCFPASAARCLSLATNALPEKADAVVVGGGVVGASTAYHLAKRGIKSVLLERHKVTSGTTWHSAAMMNFARADSNDLELTTVTKKLARETLESETGVSTGYVENGGLSITRNPKILEEFRRMVALCRYFDGDLEMVSPEQIAKLHPFLDITGVVGGMYSKTDGNIDPTSLTNSFLRGAKDNGALIFEDCAVDKIVINQGVVDGVHTQSGLINTKVVVLAAGAWSKSLAASVGVNLPMMTNKHSYVISEAIPELKGKTLPNVRVFDDSLYYKIQNETVQMGAFETNPEFVEVDAGEVFHQYEFNWDIYEPYFKASQNTFPLLKSAGNRGVICGPETFTPDGKALFGETDEVDGLYVNCGMNSRGIQASGGIGREMATLIDTGSSLVDMYNFDVTRFQDEVANSERWLKEGTHETQVRTYWPGFRFNHRFGGRNLRHSPLHSYLASKGAFFGVQGGFEVPRFYLPEIGDKLAVPPYDWYGEYGHEKRSPPSVYEKFWDEAVGFRYSHRVSEAIADEMRACRESVALFDYSAAGKMIISGQDALHHLQHHCTADVDVPVGSSVHALMLNTSGGVEVDALISRMDANKFLAVVGPDFTRHAERKLRRNKGDSCHVAVHDVTNSFGIISLQGPASKDIVSRVLPGINLDEMEYSTFKTVELEGNRLTLHRLTYVGETGYELHVPAKSCSLVINAILEVKPDLVFAGYEASANLGLESGFRLWHSDVDNADSPAEAGLTFQCNKLDRPRMHFEGKPELDALIHSGPNRRLVWFTVAPDVELNGREVIYRDGHPVGYLSRVGVAHYHHLGLGAGYVKAPKGQRVTEEFISSGTYDLDVAGTRHPAHVHIYPLHNTDYRA